VIISVADDVVEKSTDTPLSPLMLDGMISQSNTPVRLSGPAEKKKKEKRKKKKKKKAPSRPALASWRGYDPRIMLIETSGSTSMAVHTVFASTFWNLVIGTLHTNPVRLLGTRPEARSLKLGQQSCVYRLQLKPDVHCHLSS
jgi:hypothetical protein